MRKLTSLLLSLLLVFSLATTAFATGGVEEPTTSPATTGTITIGNAEVGQTYTIYEILYLESYDATSGAYSYKATETWKSFVESDAIKNVYLKTDDQGYVTWVGEADPATFAKLAKNWATTNSIGNQGSATATTTTVTFENLNLGYYLVDSTLGTLCSLDTTNPSVTIREKNGVPTNVKEVKEDSTGSWGKKNDAEIGQDVEFKSTITIPAGSENVVFKDQMSAGLTLKTASIKVYTNADMTTELAAANYTLDTTGTNDYTFKITFNQTYLDGLTAETKLYVGYTATVNENAVVGLNGNTNDSWLDYGDTTNTKSTPKSETKTYTWDLEVLKYANGDKTKKLEGVKFVLLNSAKTKVATVKNGELTGWTGVPAKGNDGEITWPANTVLTTDKDGKIKIEGLDSDTYYLREIEALPGYNILSDDVTVTITGATTGEDSNTQTYNTNLVEVENKSGTELPSTGGMGTTIFYILGSVLVLAAGVLLVTKKRMSAEN